MVQGEVADQGAIRVVNAPTTDESVLKPIEKNLYAVELGRLGGLKGGPARSKKLSARKRSQIASKAAKARWGKKQ